MRAAESDLELVNLSWLGGSSAHRASAEQL
jgi:hypothetical protein